MQRTFQLVDTVIGGTLAAWLTEQRRENRSFRTIAVELTERGIPVSHETVRRWCHEAGIERARLGEKVA